MKMTLLGTGTSTGVPVIGCHCPVCSSSDPRDQRLRASALWEVDGKKIVVDAGPDFRSQMISAKVDMVDAILITHVHYDHTGGLDDVRGFNYSQDLSVEVYAEKFHADGIRKNMSYVFVKDKYPGVPQLNMNEITLEPFYVGGVKIEPIRVMHGKMPILGFKIDKWAYITDASMLPEESMRQLANLDVLVINALRPEPHCSHFSIGQALEVVDRVKPKRAFFTHASHHFGLYDDMSRQMPDNVTIGFDGLVIE